MRIVGAKTSHRHLLRCTVFALASATAWAYGVESSSEPTVKRAAFEGVVARIQDEDSERPVQITFSKYAAIYLLDRNAAEFSAWLSRLKISEKSGVFVLFTYDVYGPRLTSVELQRP